MDKGQVQKMKVLYTIVVLIFVFGFITLVGVDIGLPTVRISKDFPTIEDALNATPNAAMVILDATKGPFMVSKLLLENKVLASENGIAGISFDNSSTATALIAGEKSTIANIKFFAEEKISLDIQCNHCFLFNNLFLEFEASFRNPALTTYGNSIILKAADGCPFFCE